MEKTVDINFFENKLKLLHENIQKKSEHFDKLQRKNKQLSNENRALELRKELLSKDLLILEHKATLLEIKNMVNAYLKSFAEQQDE